MKNKILAITLILLTFSSCKKDEEQSIVGTWNLSSIDANEAIDMNNDKIYNTDVLKEVDGCFDLIYEFKSNGTLVVTIKSSPESYQNGQLITDITKCETETITGNWKIDETNTKLTISDGTSIEEKNVTFKDQTLTMNDGFSYSDGGKKVYGDIKFIRQ